MKLRKKCLRRELYINGREDLWDEYCRLRKEVSVKGRMWHVIMRNLEVQCF